MRLILTFLYFLMLFACDSEDKKNKNDANGSGSKSIFTQEQLNIPADDRKNYDVLKHENTIVGANPFSPDIYPYMLSALYYIDPESEPESCEAEEALISVKGGMSELTISGKGDVSQCENENNPSSAASNTTTTMETLIIVTCAGHDFSPLNNKSRIDFDFAKITSELNCSDGAYHVISNYFEKKVYSHEASGNSSVMISRVAFQQEDGSACSYSIESSGHSENCTFTMIDGYESYKQNSVPIESEEGKYNFLKIVKEDVVHPLATSQEWPISGNASIIDNNIENFTVKFLESGSPTYEISFDGKVYKGKIESIKADF